MGNGRNRKIRVLNGARAILEIFQNLPFRCVFVGEMPIYLNGGRVPVVSFGTSGYTCEWRLNIIHYLTFKDLDFILIPHLGTKSPPNIANAILCQHESTKFRFSLDRNQLKYVDLSGEIPAGKQNWCKVKTILTQDPPPPRFEFDRVVEIAGIPTLRIFDIFLDSLGDLLNGYNSLRAHSQQGGSWLTRRQIKKIKTVFEVMLKKPVDPQNLDQAGVALSVSKRLIKDLSGPSPTSGQFQELGVILRKIASKIDSWTNTRRRSVIGDRGISPVSQGVDDRPEPSAVEQCGNDHHGSVIGDSGMSPVSQGVDDRPEPSAVEQCGNDRHGSVIGDSGMSPVTLAVFNSPKPAEEDHCDESDSDDWVEVMVSYEMVETHGTNSEYCGERVDDALDFVLLSID